jgi:hypothetical protein
MKRIAIAAAAACAVWPGAAAAKEIASMKVCGANGCAALTNPQTFWNDGSGGLTFDAPVGPYYRLEVAIGDPGQIGARQTVSWLRGARLTHGADQSSFDPWSRLTAAQSRRLERAAARLMPLEPALTRVTIDGKRVDDPGSYIRLFGHFAASYKYPPDGAKTVTIVVTPAHPNPWLQHALTLRYRPQLRQLERPDYEDVTLPAALTERLDAGTGRGHAALIGGIGVAGLAALALLAAAGRRRMNTNGRRRR